MLCLTKTSSNKYKQGNILLKLTGVTLHAHARSTTQRQVDDPDTGGWTQAAMSTAAWTHTPGDKTKTKESLAV